MSPLQDQTADQIVTTAYRTERGRMISANIGTAALVVFTVTSLYALADFTRSAESFRASLIPYAIQLVTPFLAWALVRGPLRGHAEMTVLAADLLYTAAQAGHLLLPTTTISGTALTLSLKMIATALLFPWAPRFQYVSVGLTYAIYLFALALGGRLQDALLVLHQLMGPMVAAAFSAMGATVADRLRRDLYSRNLQLARSEATLRDQEARLRLLIGEMPAVLWSTDASLAFTYIAGAGLRGVNVPSDARLGGTVPEFFGDAGPEFGAVVAHRRALQGEPVDYEAEWMGRVFQSHVEPRRDERQRVVGVVGAALDITDRKRREDETEALLDIARDVAATLEPTDLVGRVRQRSAMLFPGDCILTYSWNPRSNQLQCDGQSGVSTPAPLERDWEAPLGVWLTEAMRSGQTVVIDQTISPAALSAPLPNALHSASLVAVPLCVRDRLLGALVAVRRQLNRAFAAGDLRVLEAVAQQLATGIESKELYRAQEEEAEVGAALARVGSELMASLDRPVLLSRLCQLTAEVLHADTSHAFVFDATDQQYAVVAGHGDTREQWESLQVLRFPPSQVPGLIERLQRDEVVSFDASDAWDPVLSGLLRAYQVSVAMFVPLRRADSLDILTCGFRTRDLPFTLRQLRIARGISHIASLALANTELVSALENANRLKSDFVATMSHELRTPLNIILGYNELMLSREFGPLTAEQVSSLERVNASSRLLLELVNATLDLSRLESGRVVVETAEVSLPALIDELRAELADRELAPGVRLIWDVEPNVGSLTTDARKLKVVLKNLVDNAVKFTASGSVTVRVSRHGDGVEMTVADTGIGIPATLLAAIFEPFRQADQSTTRRHEGVGLGLYIVRRFVELLGGKVAVESEVGRGSRFHVWLPYRAHGVAQPPVISA